MFYAFFKNLFLGGEFMSTKMQQYLAKRQIRHFLMRNVETKAVHAERAIKAAFVPKG